MWEISYANLLMLMATIPQYESEEDKKEKVIDFGSDTQAMGNFINGKLGKR